MDNDASEIRTDGTAIAGGLGLGLPGLSERVDGTPEYYGSANADNVIR